MVCRPIASQSNSLGLSEPQISTRIARTRTASRSTSDRDPFGGYGAVQRAHGVRDAVAQFGQAQVVCVESLAALDRFDRRAADRLGRDLVALAEPEREQGGPTQAGVRAFADLRGFEVLDGLTHGECCTADSPAIVAGSGFPAGHRYHRSTSAHLRRCRAKGGTMKPAPTTSPTLATSRARVLAAVLCALALFAAGADAAARKTKSDTGDAAQPASAAKTHKPKKAGHVKFEKGGGGTRAERDRRLQRECRGLPNAGACLGYGS